MTQTPAAVSADERARLEAEAARLVAVAKGSADPGGGFGWLDEAARLVPGRPVETWVTCRMTHVFALAALHGDVSAPEFVDRGVAALTSLLRDPRHGGWFSTAGPDGRVKEGYAHAFVVLAAASATGAGHPDGPGLLEQALGVVLERFWDEQQGLVADVWDADWTVLDPYRGVNANMHTVEAFLAAAEVTGERVWLERAVRILARVVDGFAREHGWRLPEHFDERWRPVLGYNIEQPADPFRPYGVTIGHLFEWSRLALHARTALGSEAPGWLLAAAGHLYRAGVEHGWAVDGAPGFVYTTDFQDRPVVRERMHWVVAEAIAAAWTLLRDTGESACAGDLDRWWAYARRYLVDERDGSWRHELDAQNRPSSRVWSGRPDVYHAYQATILPLLPPAASFIGAAKGGW
ncbi:MAG: AGE family epimerase/isomerase [Intrasporangium sp.]|uniref:AGE family epimerase/isomerase n=1 Tax=Intrasporangium sp. TaxID=1925024 RepID=UPI0026482AB0|nr:AGE family epimerase/isomerase [Intrasporangium sp.]MDN5794620.1 AGE family epimerase/isomerase [Intrasporangium sp.]